jgi:Tfp pilus assembly protein PilO
MMFRERQQVIICVAAGAMVAGFGLFHLPLKKRAKAVERTRAAQRLAITKASAERAQLPALREQLLKLEETVGNYEANIPGNRDLGAFLQKIADLMNKHDLEEQLVQPKGELEAEDLYCISISMQCKGRLEQIFGFFRSLQLLDRSIRIEQIQLENDSDFGGEVTMRAETIIYYRSESEQV